MLSAAVPLSPCPAGTGTRSTMRVEIEDAIVADETIDMCLGADVAPRKRWIQTHAREVQNLDTVG